MIRAVMAALPRLSFARIPTPLEPAPRLSERLGFEVLIKRDDLTGLALGGNKARKLEYYMADARAAGADTVITFGGVQSNHARMTAAAAAKAGLRCLLLLGGARPRNVDGNLLLDRLFGADVEFLGLTPAELTAARVSRAFEEAARRVRDSGGRPYSIPAGGSAALGVIAYAIAYEEILEQAAGMGKEVGEIVVAFGTGGTLAGLALGNLLRGGPLKLAGISSAPPGMPAALGIPGVADLVKNALAFLADREGGAESPPSAGDAGAEAEVDYGFSGPAYGAPTPESAEAIRIVAREEAILLDPVYTGKAMAGLMARAREGGARRAAGAIVFLHTGGAPALFPYAGSLLEPSSNA